MKLKLILINTIIFAKGFALFGTSVLGAESDINLVSGDASIRVS